MANSKITNQIVMTAEFWLPKKKEMQTERLIDLEDVRDAKRFLLTRGLTKVSRPIQVGEFRIRVEHPYKNLDVLTQMREIAMTPIHKRWGLIICWAASASFVGFLYSLTQ